MLLLDEMEPEDRGKGRETASAPEPAQKLTVKARAGLRPKPSLLKPSRPRKLFLKNKEELQLGNRVGRYRQSRWLPSKLRKR